MSPSEAEPQNQQCADGEGANLSKSAKRNMKRKEKRKQQQPQDGDVDVESVSDAVENVSISDGVKLSNKAVAAAAASVSPADDSSAAEKVKKIKNLKKKLRQGEDLQQKVDSGEIEQPTKDQLEKLGRLEALREELAQLERDSWSNKGQKRPTGQTNDTLTHGGGGASAALWWKFPCNIFYLFDIHHELWNYLLAESDTLRTDEPVF